MCVYNKGIFDFETCREIYIHIYLTTLACSKLKI